MTATKKVLESALALPEAERAAIVEALNASLDDLQSSLAPAGTKRSPGESVQWSAASLA
jgi:hypothetical protein